MHYVILMAQHHLNIPAKKYGDENLTEEDISEPEVKVTLIGSKMKQRLLEIILYTEVI